MQNRLSAGRAPVVLVVDDDRDMRIFAATVLSSHGYVVRQAADGVGAIEQLRDALPDLILLDLDMPVMDGRAFCAALGQLGDERLASVPVLVVSGATDPELEAVGLGAAGALQKPVDVRRLLAAVSRVLAA